MSTQNNLSDRFMVITYYGGRNRGRCYDIIDRYTGRQRTLTESEMCAMVFNKEDK